VVLATGGYGNVYYLSTMAKGCNVTAAWRCARKGALFANPCYTQIHPTCLPQSGESQSKLTLMSESLRNDGRVWVPKTKGDKRPPSQIPETERDYYLERRYPAFGNLVPRDIASRAAKAMCDDGFGVGPSGYAVYLDFSEAINRLGEQTIRERYGNLFDMYHEITDDNPYQTPMRIYPAPHYTMGGLWVDYNLMTTIPGLYAAGEANFSDHGANRLGASALMQGLADGYFVIPATVGDYLAEHRPDGLTTADPAFAASRREVEEQVRQLLAINGNKTVRQYWWEIGRILWNQVGMSRNKAGLTQAISDLQALREDYWKNVKVGGSAEDFNKSLEFAGRIADFFELGELMARDALEREESCGGHFREEHQTKEGEALRDDEGQCHVSAWAYRGAESAPEMIKESLAFDNVHLAQRSYK
ncbi:MAG: succinate dehydrogenase (quinone) flavoprotein subunit, partial [Kiritimatiellae bacterium]|nr:succinate dehydrogenase (quinone) flavoprotein subunit [Kiritimatiellia bacterium]